MLSKPKLSKAELFRSHLEQIIDMNHSMVRLSRQINWSALSDRFGALYNDRKGRPGLPIRLMVGLTYLSRMHNLSDEAVVEQWVENPYWQYFCGFEYFQHRFPLEPSSLVRWRERIGVEGVEFLLQDTINSA
jgi:IS5 family transposase